jgi:hypothetical protein
MSLLTKSSFNFVPILYFLPFIMYLFVPQADDCMSRRPVAVAADEIEKSGKRKGGGKSEFVACED